MFWPTALPGKTGETVPGQWRKSYSGQRLELAQNDGIKRPPQRRKQDQDDTSREENRHITVFCMPGKQDLQQQKKENG
ncbi:hypothetical protein [Cedecea lapagei]|uniref:hypothetical protein n=1 Tax=Cedecea lapagei TaxID=158823 RepID=UPI001E40EDC4|nr:hypothetical protein [Cedecea lapagei]